MADARGGSNGLRSSLWKMGVQRLAKATGLGIMVCHFPPGTSKWNKIEHRISSIITQNWRGRPLVSYETIVNLIGNTQTGTGLQVKAKLRRRSNRRESKCPTPNLPSSISGPQSSMVNGTILCCYPLTRYIHVICAAPLIIEKEVLPCIVAPGADHGCSVCSCLGACRR
jgi:hypothetical protein